MRHPATRGGYTRATGGARFPLAFAMRDDDVSKYYATLSRTEAVRAIASSASPVLALAFAFVFVAGVWLGRWTVLFETRARRRHLEETVDKIVAGVVAGTSGKANPTAAASASTIADAVLAGLDRRGLASPRSTTTSAPESSPSPSPSMRRRRSAERERARAAAEAVRLAEDAAAEAEAATAELERAAAERRAAAAADAAAAAEQQPVEMDVDMEDAAAPSPSTTADEETSARRRDDEAARFMPSDEEDDGDSNFDPATSNGDADPSADSADPSEPPPESPTRTAAAAAHEAQRLAEIERQRAEAKAARKQAKSQRVVAERMESHRKGIEEQEARASKLDDARAEAQRAFEREGVHALAAAGCLEATLEKLGLYETPPPSTPATFSKVEGAYKRGLARNHPDRSAARGDDLAAAARCEELFKLLQAAHARWVQMGRPTGAVAAAKAATAWGGARYAGGYVPRSRANFAADGAYGSPGAAPGYGTHGNGRANGASNGASSGASRSWQPGQSTSASTASFHDMYRERAKRTAAAAADALRREEERLQAELDLERRRAEAEAEAAAAELRRRARTEAASRAAADAAARARARKRSRRRRRRRRLCRRHHAESRLARRIAFALAIAFLLADGGVFRTRDARERAATETSGGARRRVFWKRKRELGGFRGRG